MYLPCSFLQDLNTGMSFGGDQRGLRSLCDFRRTCSTDGVLFAIMAILSLS